MVELSLESSKSGIEESLITRGPLQFLERDFDMSLNDLNVEVHEVYKEALLRNAALNVKNKQHNILKSAFLTEILQSIFLPGPETFTNDDILILPLDNSDLDDFDLENAEINFRPLDSFNLNENNDKEIQDISTPDVDQVHGEQSISTMAQS